MSMSQSGKGLIERAEQLAQYLCDGCKPKSNWLIGTEHEKFGFSALPTTGFCSTTAAARSKPFWKVFATGSGGSPPRRSLAGVQTTISLFSNDQTIIWMLGSLDKGGNWNFSGISDREWRDSILRQTSGIRIDDLGDSGRRFSKCIIA